MFELSWVRNALPEAYSGTFVVPAFRRRFRRERGGRVYALNHPEPHEGLLLQDLRKKYDGAAWSSGD